MGDSRYFFVHIMKTAGASLVSMIRADIFPAAETYPNHIHDQDNRAPAYLRFDYVRALSEERKRKTRFFTGHIPLSAREVFGGELRTFAFIREPVARSISMLKHVKLRIPQFKRFEIGEIYDRRRAFDAYVNNFQIRAFALDPLPETGSILRPYPIDSRAFDRALKNLASLDFIGLVEDFDTSIQMLESFTGWRFAAVNKINKSGHFDMPENLAERIRNDIPLELRFYEHAKELYAEQKRKWLASQPRASSAAV